MMRRPDQPSAPHAPAKYNSDNATANHNGCGIRIRLMPTNTNNPNPYSSAPSSTQITETAANKNNTPAITIA